VDCNVSWRFTGCCESLPGGAPAEVVVVLGFSANPFEFLSSSSIGDATL
jgi:hypothetical protein